MAHYTTFVANKNFAFFAIKFQRLISVILLRTRDGSVDQLLNILHLQFLYHNIARLCIKVGRGQGDGDIGTRVWGLGTSGRETRDAGTSSMGRGDVKNWDAGDPGC